MNETDETYEVDEVAETPEVYTKKDLPKTAPTLDGQEDRQLTVVINEDEVNLYIVPKTGRPSRFACRASDLVTWLLSVPGLDFPQASGEPSKSRSRMTY